MPKNRKLSASTLDLGADSVARVPYRSDREATIRRRAQVGDRVRTIRRAQKRSQRDLGDQVGIDPRSISAFENGHAGVTLDALLDIADALGVSPAELLESD